MKPETLFSKKKTLWLGFGIQKGVNWITFDQLRILLQMGFPIQRIQDAPAEMLRKLKNQKEDFPQLAQEKQTMYLDLFPRNCDGEVITLVISSIEVIYLQ